MKKQELYNKVIAYFQEAMPVAETELHYNNPFELLIAVILSAQCTDKRVNMITPPLYRDFPTPEALAASTPEVIYEYIRSVSYPNNKAKHLVGMAQMLVKDFHSEVPGTLEELVKLPGVGRKTANVIQSVVFNKAAMAVDTCVPREPPHRAGSSNLHHTAGYREISDEIYSEGDCAHRTSLAYFTRKICLCGTDTEMFGMRVERIVPVFVEAGFINKFSFHRMQNAHAAAITVQHQHVILYDDSCE